MEDRERESCSLSSFTQSSNFSRRNFFCEKERCWRCCIRQWCSCKKNKQVTYLWAQESCRKMAGRQYVSAKEGSMWSSKRIQKEKLLTAVREWRFCWRERDAADWWSHRCDLHHTCFSTEINGCIRSAVHTLQYGFFRDRSKMSEAHWRTERMQEKWPRCSSKGVIYLLDLKYLKHFITA